MRVMIDARCVQEYQTGVSRYILNLCLGLSHIDSHFEFFILYKNKILKKVVEKIGGFNRHRFHWIEARFDYTNPLSQVDLYFNLKAHQINLFHDTLGLGIKFLNIPTISNVHDLAKIHCAVNDVEKEKNRKKIKSSLKKSKLLLTSSLTNAHDIEKYLHFSMPKIRIVYYPIDPHYFEKPNLDEIKSARTRYVITGRYILCVTNLERLGKNIDFALEVARKWQGEETWVFTLPESMKNKEDNLKIKFIDKVSDPWLKALYADASAVFMPSIYEGFSTPPLEALASQTIPFVSAISVHEEILGAVLNKEQFFDPQKIESAHFALRSILDGGEPLKQVILERFKNIKDKFSFIETAKKVHQIYCESL
jgi:hypothetical protein